MGRIKVNSNGAERSGSFIALLLSIITISPLVGQITPGENMGSGISGEPPDCGEMISLYRAALQKGDTESAPRLWQQAAGRCPHYSAELYDDGETIYSALFRHTGDYAMIDTLIMILTQKVYYFGNRPATELHKAELLFDLAGDDPGYLGLCYNILAEVADSYAGEMSCDDFVRTAVVAASLYAMGEIDGAELERSLVMAINSIDQRIERDPEGCAKSRELEDLLTFYRTSGVMTCEGIDALFGEKIDRNFRDTVLVNMVYDMLTETGCTGSDIYYNIAVKKFAVDRSVENALRLAELNAARNNMDKAVSYFTEAYNADTNPDVRSDVLLRIARVDLARGKRQEARNRAEHAWELNKKNGRALMTLAECYAGAGTSNKFDSLAVYWVAADYLEAAVATDPTLREEASALITTYKKNFPTREDCFFRRILDEGVVYTVGGWINEITTVRFRKE